MRHRIEILFCAVVLAASLFAASPKREMRAAWIATVANIDWPQPEAVGNVEQQQQDMLAMLDSLQSLHFNTVIFQVRPTADALYRSELEPWSIWLMGQQGVAPSPAYDPLEFVVQEAHRRCMDVHVWLNPYRVTNKFSIQEIASNHIYHQHPEWFVRYGELWYFDPGQDATREFLNRVVADIVARYDIDAIHMDDYFYPYRVKGMDFPDEKTFRAFPRGFDNKGDWRRNNVNMIIRELQQTIKSIKPWVEFGISPFGVWRNKANDPMGSDTQAGVQNYDDLYADILLWLREGWIDYVTPQLYWEIGKRNADYAVLLRWWGQHSYGHNLYIGVYASQLGLPKHAAAWDQPNEICRQLRMERTEDAADGLSFYSTKYLLRNLQGLCDSLTTDYYRYVALPPRCRQMHYEMSAAPHNLRYRIQEGKEWIEWEDTNPSEGGNATARYVVYCFDGAARTNFNRVENILCVTTEKKIDLQAIGAPAHAQFYVTAVNRFHVESEPSNPVCNYDVIEDWIRSLY